MSTVSKVFMFIIPLVVLIVVLSILFRPEEGLFEKVKGLILGAKEVLPKVSIGLEEQKAEVTISDVHRKEIIQLKDVIEGMVNIGNENCFANAGPLSDLGEKETSFKFELQGDKTMFTVYGGAGGKQIITDLSTEFTAVKPCVIAGKGGISKNFFTSFIEGEELSSPYFKEVNSLTISYGTSGDNGNRIRVGDFDSDTVNDEGDNLENDGWLFTPDGLHICFFSTNKVANYDDDGIDNDYFTLGEENSIKNRIDQGKLKYCR